ncbi:MAG: sugar transferase [Actinomycetes bacterium]
MPVDLNRTDDLEVRIGPDTSMPVVVRRPTPFWRLDGDHPAPRGLTSARLFLAVDFLSILFAIELSRSRALHALSFGILVLALNAATGLNRSRLTFSILDDVAPVLVNASVAFAFATTIAVLTGPSRLATSVAPLIAYLVLEMPLRAAAYAFIRLIRSRGWVAHRAVIVGAGELGGQLANLLDEHPECGVRPFGFLDSKPFLKELRRPVPVLGTEHDLASVITRHAIKHVFVGFSSVSEPELVEVIRTCDRQDCEIFLVPRMYELAPHGGRDIDNVWGLPVVRLRRAVSRSMSWRVKRWFDASLAAVLGFLLFPVFALCAAAVRLEGGPGVLFRQVRVGRDGNAFTLLKFRTMKPTDEQESEQMWNIVGDQRIGPVGRFLRKSSLDELPQLWNVLVGDMSFVGPRPERPHFVRSFSEQFRGYPARHRVPSGLTGWAQIHGLRGDTSIAERARFDNYYIENWSLWLDVRVLLRTVLAVLRGQGG